MADEMPNEEQSTRARTGSGAERWALVLVPVLLIGVGLAACGAGGGTAATTVGSSSSTTELTAPTTSSAVAAPCAALAELAATGQDASQVGEAAAALHRAGARVAPRHKPPSRRRSSASLSPTDPTRQRRYPGSWPASAARARKRWASLSPLSRMHEASCVSRTGRRSKTPVPRPKPTPTASGPLLPSTRIQP